MFALIDADPIVYANGFAAEQRIYVIAYEDANGELHEISFDPTESKTSLEVCKEWKEKNEHSIVIEFEDYLVCPEPLSHALGTVKATLEKIRRSIAEEYNVEERDITLRCLLTGKGNFRDDIATVREYKGNRKEAAKPYHYKAIRQYLVDHWDAEVINGWEADDECSISANRLRQQGIPYVVCSVDKDLDQIVGAHYDYRRDIHYKIDEHQAKSLFYQQVLAGDSTDNIPGCRRVGLTTARKLLADALDDDPIDEGMVWREIVDRYELSLQTFGDLCEYYEKAEREGAEAVALEMARLVKMQDYEGQLWTPYDRLDERFFTEELP